MRALALILALLVLAPAASAVEDPATHVSRAASDPVGFATETAARPERETGWALCTVEATTGLVPGACAPDAPAVDPAKPPGAPAVDPRIEPTRAVNDAVSRIANDPQDAPDAALDLVASLRQWLTDRAEEVIGLPGTLVDLTNRHVEWVFSPIDAAAGDAGRELGVARRDVEAAVRGAVQTVADGVRGLFAERPVSTSAMQDRAVAGVPDVDETRSLLDRVVRLPVVD